MSSLYFSILDIHPMTVSMPIERIVAIGGTYGPETLCAFEAQDRIVGVLSSAKQRGELRTFLEDKTVVGTSSFTWNIEKIVEQEPDIVLAYAFRFFPDYEEQLDAFGVPLVQMDFHAPAKYSKETRNLGWILNEQERAEELVNFEQQHIDRIKERVEDLEPGEKQRVYFEWYKDYQAVGSGTANHNAIVVCGGVNIFEDETGYPTIDPEAVPARDPQVIIRCCNEKDIFGYDATDTAPLEEKRDGILTRDGWADIDAITSERVYLLSTYSHSTHTSVFYSYIAKWLHPELFEDIDPVEVHSDWFEEFLGIEYKGLYAYPSYPVP
ncbi:MAG: hypothetical protein DRH12_11360 [Deltaproteobacteria bacterium]|nr:MAG: hypothetical protein DRH12_11360 [Deltaproteobacteria bacterium]